MFGWLRKLGRDRRTKDASRPRGFLSRIARDRRGNTLAIIGASLIPLTAMIGSGVDISRAYMAKTRLQSACDAAALAGRRAMTGDNFTQAVQDEAVRFFNYNFPQGTYQTATFTPTVTKPTPGTIRVSASTTIPTAIMGIFGFGTLPLSVTCDGSQNYVNTDVMLVLDTTGSMLCTPEDTATSCTQLTDPATVDANGVRGLTTTRIYALRGAVMALQNALAPVQTQLEAAGMRLRYGLVPYSSSVNVGAAVMGVNDDYITTSTAYQSRVANYTTQVRVATDTPITAPEAGLLVSPGVERFRNSGVDRQISNTNCDNFGNNIGFTQSGTSPVGGTFASTGAAADDVIYDPDGNAAPTTSAPAAPTGYIRYQFTRNTASWSGSPANRVCDRNVTITRRTYPIRYAFTNWSYQQATYDTSAYASGGNVTIATNTGGTVENSGSYTVQQLPTVATNVTTIPVTTALTTGPATPWNGCIEERQTVSSITTSDDLTIPDGAYDLRPDFIPNTPETTWRPMWPQLSYLRNGTSQVSRGEAYYACPTAARRLQAWTGANLLTYVNSLTPVGGTYHDVGMIWGTRLLSSAGIFSDSPTTFANMPVSRHIIFMTDGQLAPNTDTYTAYGVETLDRRVTNSSSANGQYDRHLQRFKMMCNQARAMNMSIWVIALSTALSQDMIDCASNPNQAFTAANRQQLIDQFTLIGQNIGALRLTQ